MKKYLLFVVMVLVLTITACDPGSGSGSVELPEVCYQDALKIRNAAALYCAANACSDYQELSYSDISDGIDVFNTTKYDFTATNDVVAIQQGSSQDWFVTLERVGTGEYEFPFDMDPVDYDETVCTIDNN